MLPTSLRRDYVAFLLAELINFNHTITERSALIQFLADKINSRISQNVGLQTTYRPEYCHFMTVCQYGSPDRSTLLLYTSMSSLVCRRDNATLGSTSLMAVGSRLAAGLAALQRCRPVWALRPALWKSSVRSAAVEVVRVGRTIARAGNTSCRSCCFLRHGSLHAGGLVELSLTRHDIIQLFICRNNSVDDGTFLLAYSLSPSL